MLPESRQVGELEVDDLNVVFLDEIGDLLASAAVVNCPSFGVLVCAAIIRVQPCQRQGGTLRLC